MAANDKTVEAVARTYGNCPQCNYSVTPDEILGEERKHFWPHSLRCVRCHYQTETKRTWPEAIAAWNRQSLGWSPPRSGGVQFDDLWGVLLRVVVEKYGDAATVVERALLCWEPEIMAALVAVHKEPLHADPTLKDSLNAAQAVSKKSLHTEAASGRSVQCPNCYGNGCALCGEAGFLPVAKDHIADVPNMVSPPKTYDESELREILAEEMERAGAIGSAALFRSDVALTEQGTAIIAALSRIAKGAEG